jgi:hypothetical protein
MRSFVRTVAHRRTGGDGSRAKVGPGMHALSDPTRFAVDIACTNNGAVRAPRLNAGKGFLPGQNPFIHHKTPYLVNTA